MTLMLLSLWLILPMPHLPFLPLGLHLRLPPCQVPHTLLVIPLHYTTSSTDCHNRFRLLPFPGATDGSRGVGMAVTDFPTKPGGPVGIWRSTENK